MMKVSTHDGVYTIEAAGLQIKDGIIFFINEYEDVVLMIPAASLIYAIPYEEADIGKANG